MFAKVHFFQDKSKQFINSFVHELKPITLSITEVLYLQGDDASEIYFISRGRVKLIVDLHGMITDPYLIAKMKSHEERNHELNYGIVNRFHSDCVERSFIFYSEGGYFGDSDVLPFMSGHCNFKGRDSNCMGDKETTIFVLRFQEIRRIRR